MIGWIEYLGRSGLAFFERLGRGHIFMVRAIMGMPGLILKPWLLIAQLYSVGVLSLQIIAVSGLSVGMVLGLQMFNTLVDFGAED